MDLNLKALIGITYLIPIAITLRKIYSPSFDIPDSIALVVAKIDKARLETRGLSQHDDTRSLELQP
jgi:hypothetical protein